MKCPSCNEETSLAYNVPNVCKNKICKLYLKDDVSKLNKGFSPSIPASEKSKKINEIMSEFDFQKVHKCMVALDWIWSDGTVPSLMELRQCAKQLLEGSYSEVAQTRADNYGISTGGFSARAYLDNNIELRLTFSIDEWDTF